MKRTILVAAAIALLALVGLTGSPAGAQYGPFFTATLSDVTVVPGQVVTVEGFCPDDDTVLVTMGGISVGSISVENNGSIGGDFSGQVVVPDLDPGEYLATAECGGEVLSAEITVLAVDDGDPPATVPVTAPGSGSGTDSLARTGSSSTDTLVKVGAGLLLAGGAAALTASKRRARTA